MIYLDMAMTERVMPGYMRSGYNRDIFTDFDLAAVAECQKL